MTFFFSTIGVNFSQQIWENGTRTFEFGCGVVIYRFDIIIERVTYFCVSFY